MLVHWEAIIQTIDLGSFPMRIEFSYDELTTLLTCHFEGAGQMIPARPIVVPRLVTRAIANAVIRREAQRAVLHELDECLHIGGRKVNDPHVVQPQPDYRT